VVVHVVPFSLNSRGQFGHLDGKPPKKVIYVPDKLVSIVA
jgi:hypothetical protein